MNGLPVSPKFFGVFKSQDRKAFLLKVHVNQNTLLRELSAIHCYIFRPSSGVDTWHSYDILLSGTLIIAFKSDSDSVQMDGHTLSFIQYTFSMST